jgi:hypothetical protein
MRVLIAILAALSMGQTATSPTQVDMPTAMGVLGGIFLVWKLFEPFYQKILDRLPSRVSGNSKKQQACAIFGTSDVVEVRSAMKAQVDEMAAQTKLLQSMTDSLQNIVADNRYHTKLLENIERRRNGRTGE